MAKKKKPVAPVRPVPPRPAPQAVTTPASQTDRQQPFDVAPALVREQVSPTLQQHSPNGLIRFDRRVMWFLGICVGLFLVLSLAKIHIVSVPMWNQIIPDGSDPKRGLISGNPRQIRMDDWAVGTPWTLSQVNQDFPTENRTLGPGKTPVLTTPTRHLVTVFKPIFWGFFILDADAGYAWINNLRACLNLIGAALLLLLLTRNQFWPSVFGSCWLFMSSAMQAWAYVPADVIAYGCLLTVAGIYLIWGKTRAEVIAGGLLSTFLIPCFALALYPPFQVPMAYLMLAILAGYSINEFSSGSLLKNLPLKLIGAMTAVGVGVAVLFFWYQDVKSTLELLTSTVYPGKRVIHGGDGFIANWFSEYFSWQVSDAKYPSTWSNYCEMAHYLTFIPVVLPGAVIWMRQQRRPDWLLILLSVYILLMLSWIELGWPDWLGQLTFMNQSKGARTQIPFGIGGVLLTIVYLSRLQVNPLKNNVLYTGLGIAGAVVFMVFAAQANVADSGGFFKFSQLILPVMFFSVLLALLWPTWNPPYRTAIFGVGVLLFLAPNLKINPVSVGLAPITENVVYKTIKDIQQRDPKARWVVFGQPIVSYLATATGIDLLSGVKYAPNLLEYHVLDPAMKSDSVYNRYAHTMYNSYVDPAHPDTVLFQVPVEDHIQVLMDPCSPKLKKLGVKYIIFDHQPQPAETRCLKLVISLGTLAVYQTEN